jgi:hypothetical protein
MVSHEKPFSRLLGFCKSRKYHLILPMNRDAAI